jgi:hypothetical protein
MASSADITSIGKGVAALSISDRPNEPTWNGMPTEIQLLIWRHTLTSRFMSISRGLPYNCSVPRVRGLPVISRVNKQSRALFLEIYEACGHPRPGRVTYYSPTLDITKIRMHSADQDVPEFLRPNIREVVKDSGLWQAVSDQLISDERVDALEELIGWEREAQIARLPKLNTLIFPNVEAFWTPWNVFREWFGTVWAEGGRLDGLRGWDGQWMTFRYWADSGKVEMAELPWEDVRELWNFVKGGGDRVENHPRERFATRHGMAPPQWRYLMVQVVILRRGAVPDSTDQKVWTEIQPYNSDEDQDTFRARMFWKYLAVTIANDLKLPSSSSP